MRLQLTCGYIIEIWTRYSPARICHWSKWRKGTGYNYGMMSPNYPVPAFDNHTIIGGDAVWQWQERKGYMRLD